jgi:hypothetical protein
MPLIQMAIKTASDDMVNNLFLSAATRGRKLSLSNIESIETEMGMLLEVLCLVMYLVMITGSNSQKFKALKAQS